MTIETETREWGVLLKTLAAPDGPAPNSDQLARLLGALPGADKKLTGEGRDFTVAWWVEAPDAAAATRLAADTVRQIASKEGLPDLMFIRSHAASVEGRFPDDPALAPEVDPADAWSIALKAIAPVGAARATPELLDQVREALGRSEVLVTLRGDPEKFLLDDGSGFTVRLWVEGADPVAAIGAARLKMLAALSQVGLEDWVLVRIKAWAPLQKQGDSFPGSHSRQPTAPEEMR